MARRKPDWESLELTIEVDLLGMGFLKSTSRYSLPIKHNKLYHDVRSDYCNATLVRSSRGQHEAFLNLLYDLIKPVHRSMHVVEMDSLNPFFNWSCYLRNSYGYSRGDIQEIPSYQQIENLWVEFSENKLKPKTFETDCYFGDIVRSDKYNMLCCKVPVVNGHALTTWSGLVYVANASSYVGDLPEEFLQIVYSEAT